MVSLMNLAEFGYRSAETIETALIWFRLSGLWAIILALMLHISLITTGRADYLKKSYIYPMIYFPAILFVLIGVLTDLLIGFI